MLEFEILARGLFRPDQLEITYNPALRMPLPPTVREWMEQRWQQKLAAARAKGTPLYDAHLFRLISTATRPEGMLHLVLGDGSYKEYVTTREAAFSAGRAREELGNVLAVCSVVETSDGYILLDKRQGVDGYAGRYHVIGGFFERDLDIVASPDEPTTGTGSAVAIKPDPFRAVRREIREETGIQQADIREQYCLGVVYDLTMPHGEMCFLTRLRIPLSEAQTRVPEEQEIQQLRSLHVTRESLTDFLRTHHGNISPTGEPNLLLYGALLYGEEWFEEMIDYMKS
ncbi:MAG TPA: NUDIX hydrolase [Ktedonobacteraceae bacterium]|nr:NUDIX hydrolase [Ktedonobacteraceae bacterium]